MSSPPLRALTREPAAPVMFAPLAAGPLFAAEVTDGNVSVRGWDGAALTLEDAGSHYVFVMAGPATLRAPDAGQFSLRRGMYVALPSGGEVRGGRGIVISQTGVTALFSLGGPIEACGRLRYIDGATDTLILPPPVLGDPCLNMLHLPPGTQQTMHAHPSLRAGIIARGHGTCVTPTGRHPLVEGEVFLIPPHADHRFVTDADSLDVIAFHPDTDTGPSHGDHPMLNRTWVDGESAAQRPDIRTPETAVYTP